MFDAPEKECDTLCRIWRLNLSVTKQKVSFKIKALTKKGNGISYVLKYSYNYYSRRAIDLSSFYFRH
jgi:hypothetical protein